MAVKEPPPTAEPGADQSGTGPPDRSVERLLWTPTEGEDATKILFPLSRYAEATFHCSCGSDIRVHWKVGTGLNIGNYSVRCPSCGTPHDMPDQPIRVFRREGDDWTPIPFE